jgi:hypothetical protein
MAAFCKVGLDWGIGALRTRRHKISAYVRVSAPKTTATPIAYAEDKTYFNPINFPQHAITAAAIRLQRGYRPVKRT